MTNVTGRPARGPDPDLSMVYGGGGPFGIAFGAGVAMGLRSAGLAVGQAPALGTSAGSWVASILALDLTYEEVAALEVPRVPTKQPNAVADIARRLLGDARHPLVSGSAFRIKGGRRGRTILRGDDHDLADICAASSGAPGLLPAHDVAGATYVDGGMRSITSIPHATPARRVIVVAPMAKGVAGVGGTIAQLQLDHERRVWRKRNPGRLITVITPTPEIARHAATGTMDLFDAAIAQRIYPLAVDLGERWGQAHPGQREPGLLPARSVVCGHRRRASGGR